MSIRWLRDIYKPPRPRLSKERGPFYLMARPPLLDQGGEFAPRHPIFFKLLDGEPGSIRCRVRGFVFDPDVEGACVEHGRIDPVRELAAIVGTQAQWVILSAIWPLKVRHRSVIGSETGSCHEDGVAGFDAVRGQFYLRLGHLFIFSLAESEGET